MRHLKPSLISILWALQSSLVFAQEESVLNDLAESPSTQPVYINQIRCEGAVKTSCEDLISVLSAKPQRLYQEDELNALNVKLKQLGYFSYFSVSLEPLQTANHANLVLRVVEKSTVRHAVNASLNSAYGNKTLLWSPQVSYAYSDHNFLGKGYFFQGSVEGMGGGDGPQPQLTLSSLEMAAPLKDAWIASLRLLKVRPTLTSLPRSNDQTWLLAGLGYQLSENSILTGYVGTSVGFNYTYNSEDNSFIPTKGSLVSIGYLQSIGSTGQKSDIFYDYTVACDARANWQIGNWGAYQGVLTIDFIKINSEFNPTFRPFADANKNTGHKESGITYSLVHTGKDGRRSAKYFGLEGATYSPSNGQFMYTIGAGYKASLESLDLSLGILLTAGGVL